MSLTKVKHVCLVLVIALMASPVFGAEMSSASIDAAEPSELDHALAKDD
jgi:hypothetical protein